MPEMRFVVIEKWYFSVFIEPASRAFTASKFIEDTGDSSEAGSSATRSTSDDPPHAAASRR